MARVRAAPAEDAAVATQRTTRQALKEKTNNTVRPKKPVYEFKENIEEFVKPARPRRTRAKQTPHNENDFVMAGGLGEADGQAQDQQASDSAVTPDAVTKSDAPAASNAKSNRRPARMMKKVVRTEAKSNTLDDLKKRMLADNNQAAVDSSEPAAPELPIPSGSQRLHTSTRQSKSTSKERSAQSFSPDPPPERPRSIVADKRSSIAQPPSALKSQGTPTVETSTLALKNFKRRPRQPSMLQMVQQRTASARPSLVNTSAMHDAGDDDIDDIDDFDEEEFAPDAVGTPLNLKKPTAPIRSDPTRKRKMDEIDSAPSTVEATRSKRQRSAESELDENDRVAKSQSRQASTEPQHTPQPEASAEVQVINSSPSSSLTSDPLSVVRNSFAGTEPAIPSTAPNQRQKAHPKADEDEDANDTMAEPLSSSPPPSRPTIMSTADIMADPLTQASPQRKRNNTKKEKPKPMTTARLQSLLPKRRTRAQPRPRKSDYDLDSNSENEDQQHSSDEDDGETNTRHRRRTKWKPQPKSKKPTADKTKPKIQQSKALTRKSNLPAPAPSTAGSKQPKPKKTYSRVRANTTTTSDKENENEAASDFEDLPDDNPSALPDTSISMIEAGQSAELEAARKKFADIDDWEMEFESMSVEEGRSSSQEWR